MHRSADLPPIMPIIAANRMVSPKSDEIFESETAAVFAALFITFRRFGCLLGLLGTFAGYG